MHCGIHFNMPDYSCSKNLIEIGHSLTANPFKVHLLKISPTMPSVLFYFELFHVISYLFYVDYFQLVVFEVKRIFNDQVTALLTKLENQQSIKQDLSAFIAMMSRVRAN